MIVDGVLASCYPSGHHDISHLFMTPMQLFPKVMEWIFGHNNGMSVYVMLSEEVGEWMQLIEY